MTLRKTTLTALLLATVGVGCQGAEDGQGAATGGDATHDDADGEDAGVPLAKVNGMQVASGAFEQQAARKAPEDGEALSAEERKEVLDKLIDDKLLYQAALQKGLDKDPKVQKVMVNTLLREVVYGNVRNSDFTDEELQAFYEANKEDFVVPEKVQIKRILIKVSDERPEGAAKAEAERVRGEVAAAPESFKDLAAKHSEDPYRRRGGDVGFVPRSGKPGLDPEVVETAFTLSQGDVSDVFKTSEGYNIVMVANRRDRVERTFQQMKGSVLRKVKNERLKELYEAYVAELRQGAAIEIDEAALAAVEIQSARSGPPRLNLGRPGASLGEMPMRRPAAGGAGDDEGDDAKGGSGDEAEEE